MANVPAYVEMSGRVLAMLQTSPLCHDLCNIIMDYFEGLYSDEIKHIWNKAHKNHDMHYRWYNTIAGYKEIVFNYDMNPPNGSRHFRKIMDYLDIQFDHNARDKEYWKSDFKMFLISINHIWDYPDSSVKKSTVITPAMLNGIYILICAAMQHRSTDWNTFGLPVWDYSKSEFGPYMKLYKKSYSFISASESLHRISRCPYGECPDESLGWPELD